jgi:hypothetical protein
VDGLVNPASLSLSLSLPARLPSCWSILQLSLHLRHSVQLKLCMQLGVSQQLKLDSSLYPGLYVQQGQLLQSSMKRRCVFNTGNAACETNVLCAVSVERYFNAVFIPSLRQGAINKKMLLF